MLRVLSLDKADDNGWQELAELVDRNVQLLHVDRLYFFVFFSLHASC